MKIHSLIFLLLCCAIAGCSSRSPNGDTSGTEGLKPRSAHDAASPDTGLKFTPPPGWIAETPSGSIRKAQYRLPRIQGDPEDAELVVYYFQGEGGTPQANVDRWIGQFTGSGGKPAPDAAKVTHKTVDNIPLTIVDVSGTYSNSMGAMQQGGESKPNFRMLGAIAEAKDGPWFFKLTGPERTVAKWAPGFESFLDSLHY
jgi:hypothetical protein